MVQSVVTVFISKKEDNTMLTRFAPSPTGYLHIGNMRTALLCYLYAQKSGGQLLLRIDDTDLERSKPEYEEAIKRDLAWLGIVWDKSEKQSSRFDRYALAVEKLKADGRLYPCYETDEELDIKRKIQAARGLPPLYDRAALDLTDTQKAEFEAKGIKPHWRFKFDEQDSEWDDEIRGSIKINCRQSTSDTVLIRENGVYTYMLPSTVDDIEMGVTHVMRGEDHVSNTAAQIQIFRALGADIPTFAHCALIEDKDGKLSKRLGSAGMEAFREEYIASIAVASYLAKMGTSDPIQLRDAMEQLVDEFDINKFGKSRTQYSLEEIERLNSKLMHEQKFSDVEEQLKRLDIHVDENFWEAVKANIESLTEVKQWYDICKQPLEPVADEAEFMLDALSVLPEGEWNEGTWSEWTGLVKEKTGRKGKQLFMPIRQALTGMDHGPELKVLLPLIGRERVQLRLQGKKA